MQFFILKIHFDKKAPAMRRGKIYILYNINK